jgi:hypothetical protein
MPRRDSIVVCVGFLTGGLHPAAILASGMPVVVSGPTVSLGVIVGHRFGCRLMFFSEPLVHKSYDDQIDTSRKSAEGGAAST